MKMLGQGIYEFDIGHAEVEIKIGLACGNVIALESNESCQEKRRQGWTN